MAASTPPARVIGPAALILVIGWALALPLRDVLAYPERISVLPNLQTDALTYHRIASDLSRTWSLEALPPRHPPGWVTLLAALYSVAGPSFIAGKLVSWLALLASVAGCAILARRVWSPALRGEAAWIAAILGASSPALRGYVGTLQYEVLTGAMLLAVLLLTDVTARSQSSRALHLRAALTGLTAGALVLTRETFLIMVPLIALWMAVRARALVERRAAVTAAVLLTSVALTPAVIWSAVQSVRHGTLITISEKGPMVVAFGNNPLANGTYNAPLVGVGEPSGLAFVRHAPGRSLVLAGRKALYFWGVLRDGWNVPRPAAVWAWRVSTGLAPFEALTGMARGGWLLALFVLALWCLGREGWHTWWVLPAIVFVLMAVHGVTLSSHRFAVPVLPIVFVLGSGPLTAVVRPVLAAMRSPAVAVSAAILMLIAIAMQFQAWPLAHTYRAVELDGIDADNLVDPVTGRAVRFAAASRGHRPVLLLPDEYLPAGSLTLGVRLRRASALLNAAAPLARITLVQLDGRIACTDDVAAGDLLDDRVTAIEIPCWLSSDTPATVAVHSLGGADFAIDAIRLSWGR